MNVEQVGCVYVGSGARIGVCYGIMSPANSYAEVLSTCIPEYDLFGSGVIGV